MKNIFLLPTEKEFNYKTLYLFKCIKEFSLFGHDYKLGDVLDNTYFESDRNYWQPQFVYITNDENIEDGNWVFQECLNMPHRLIKTDTENVKVLNDLNKCKKIVLTTDQDLIKDGVQAIDNKFLEWFVKNPSCESVEVSDYIKQIGWESDANGRDMILNKRFYEIIIPKEEPKPFKDMLPLTKIEWEKFKKNPIPSKKEEPKQECFITKCMQLDAEIAYKSLPKQETLEEATNNYSSNKLSKLGFIEGAKWQQERSYSEEEVINILKKGLDNHYLKTNKNHLKIWFEQFKK